MQIPKEHLLNDDPFPSILGQEDEKTQIRSALLSEHHIILVGPPGIGKTTLAKDIAKLLPEDFITDPLTGEQSEKKHTGEDRFIRVQGSPDLTAEDLIGDIDPMKAMQHGPLSIEAFTPGKLFKAHNGVLFFDELNRTSEKLQNALLQVLEEGVITISGYTIDVPTKFVFIGTMNPDDSSTEPLSDVFLDRFDLIYVTHPKSSENEKKIIEAKGKYKEIKMSSALTTFLVEFIRKLRNHEQIAKRPSVRATLSLYERAKANAVLAKRSEVILKDIQDAVVSVLAHRMELKPSVKFLKNPTDFLREELTKFEHQNPSLLEEDGQDP